MALTATRGLITAMVTLWAHSGSAQPTTRRVDVLTDPLAVTYSAVGSGIALDGDVLLVGVPHFGGSALVYRRTGGVWSMEQRLGELDSGSGFGSSVSVSGDTAFVGAPFEDSSAGSNSGAVHLFERDSGIWLGAQRLVADDASADRHFGSALALDGETLAISGCDPRGGGLSSEAYVFERAAGVWLQRAHVVPRDERNRHCWWALDLEADWMALGAPGQLNAAGEEVGAVFLFRRQSDGSWAEHVRIDSPRSTPNWFGSSVSLSGDVLAVGAMAQGAVTDGHPIPGVYIFRWDGSQWMEEAFLVPAGAPVRGQLGFSVAVRNDQVIVGAPQVWPGGRAFVFHHTAGSWVFDEALPMPEPVGEMLFGYRVALSERGFAVSATWAPVGGVSRVGAVYVYSDRFENGATCETADECHSGFCVDGVCCDSACGDGATDCMACSAAAGGAIDGTCGPAPSSVVCRPSIGPCDPGTTCDGAGLECPLAVVPCDDSNVCTADSCDALGACAHAPIDGCCTGDAQCDDGDACTDDSCASSVCRHDAIEGCCGDCDAGTDAGADRDAGAGVVVTYGCGCSAKRDAGSAASVAVLVVVIGLLRRRSRVG
jgi:uncharacterized protein (TIGR03382 family)